MTELADLRDADVHALSQIEALVTATRETRDAVHALASGADDWKRLAWGTAALNGQSYDLVEFGEAMQGWLVVNDGPTDVYVALSDGRLNAAGRIITVPAGSWAALPLVTSRLYFGPTVAGAAGTALVFALLHAPAVGFGTLAGAAESSSTVTKITIDGTAQTLASANGSRRGTAIYNDSSATLYVKLGDAATTDDWTIKLNASDYYELPGGYAGNVTAIGTNASGQVRVSEFA